MDYIASKIDAVNKSHFGFDCTSVTPDKRKRVVEGLLAKVFRQIRSSFTVALGKRKRALSPPPPVPSTPTNPFPHAVTPTTSRQSSSVSVIDTATTRAVSPVPPTNALSFTTPKKARLASTQYNVSPPSSDFGIPAFTVCSFPTSRKHPNGLNSITNIGTRRLQSNDIVRLLVGEQIIIVIPSETPDVATNDKVAFRKKLTKF